VTVQKKTVILNTYPKIAPAAVPGGKDTAKLPEALASVRAWVEGKIK
jgi:hypothetical protein